MDREASTSHSVLERMLLDESAEPTQLPLSLLESITNRFSLDHQIGIGGYAVVYKGMVGKGIVAVKKLSNTFCVHENKFHEEVKCLIMAKHKYVVRFLGYCAETQGKIEKYDGKLVMVDQRNWLLCFEYACNGSLDKHITDATSGLNWRERFRIIRGVCEGLCFLHEMRILHLDLKPANILLDGHMEPKIADFGLSRCLGEDQTRVITENLRGTLGYMDPEYIRSRQISFASDIYSLGVVIMEMLTGAKRYLEDEYVVGSWLNRLDASEGGMQLEQVKVCSKIGIECMNLDPKKRPVARHIIDMLNQTASAYYSYESSLAELKVCLPREQLGERIVEIADESVLEPDIKKHSETLEDSLRETQETKQNANRHGTNIFGFIPTMFNNLNLDIFNWKSHIDSNRNNMSRTLEQSCNIRIFRKKELKPILRSSNLIGKGAIAEVYKGVVDHTQVAIKKYGNAIRDNRFANEVHIQSQAIHKNIVRLIGCCIEMDTPILVYEFIHGASLHEILHSNKKVALNLDVRLNIVVESAHGLAHLHSKARILHGDIKPENILLDDNFMPKIDFGLSRLIATDMQHPGHVTGDYMDPVYLQNGRLTKKSDVYSFGIVILELISRKKATYTDNNNMLMSFLDVQENGKEATELFDNEIALTAGDLKVLYFLAKIAVKCLNFDGDERPTMTDLAKRLLKLQRDHGPQVIRQQDHG